MKQLSSRVKEMVNIFSQSRKTYRKLQKHLNKQPVGFPASISGVELRLLREVFALAEADLALEMDYKFQSFDKIYEKVKERGYSENAVQNMLDNMEKNGAIFVKMVNGKKQYALHPYIVGIFEMKVNSMTPDYYMDIRKYFSQSFGVEFLTSKIPQMRVIPIQKSLSPDMHIATYDEIRELVLQNEGRTGLATCICRKGKDLIGRPCKATERREMCIGFADFHDMYVRNGFGRSISKEEAFEILAENEKEGLVLMPSNCQQSQFVCSCCDCCCGILETVSILAKPGEFVKSNFYAVLDADKCNACGKCAKKCKTVAIKTQKMEDGKKIKATAIDLDRCIGCGVCVAACKSGALSLKKKEVEFVPPLDMDEMYEVIMQHKKNALQRTIAFGRAVTGI
ncbi:MAG: 4Fe-4S binding protein [Desulfobacterales bacterium]|nr:4Fe-4S binding protein [Desulfobacterales bacterium]